MAAVMIDRVWAGERGRPRFLHDPRPAVSWQISTDLPGWLQAGATVEIRVAGAASSVHTVTGRGSQRVPWPGQPLRAHEVADVRVRVAGEDGSASDWSAWVSLETGPLGPDDWCGELITCPDAPEPKGTLRFRSTPSIPASVRRAVLSVTAHGVYQVTVNGSTLEDEVLAPGWTAYDDVLTFQTHDVTSLLRPGDNVLGVTVADGWFGEEYGFHGNTRRRYEGPLALSAQLRVEAADGTVTTFATGSDWETTTAGPVLAAGIYLGETYDSRLEDGAFADAALPLPQSRPAEVLDGHLVRLVPASSPPVRVQQELPVAEVLTTPSGRTVLDFGQNLVGWLRLRTGGPAGHTITVRHAEVLERGELGVRPLRHAAATDRWTLDGSGVQDWSPRFTFHGFRYAEVEGWPGALDPSAVTAAVIHSDMQRTGHLATGDELLDRLHSNVVWGMRGNFVSLPTDCPQRDERLGWTGDIQAFAPTASYLFDTDAFLGSWLRDLAAEQRRRGGVVPYVVPDALPGLVPPTCAWGDAATFVPLALWRAYGDVAVLRRQYGSMRDWVDAEAEAAGEDLLWTGGFQFGDWLDPAAPPDQPRQARTDADIVATAYFCRSAQIVADVAAVLGESEDAARYGELAVRARTAFRHAYVTPSGRMVCDAQTAYALAIVFRLVEGSQRQAAGDRLADLVRAHGYRIGTGFVGTPLVLDALTSTGHVDEAYRLLQQEECPSWLYPVTMGATTVWERWDSMLPDGSINPGDMTSFNHYALGAVADWMHRVIGGIAPAEPGYSVVEVAPVPGGRVRAASASLDSGYGRIAVRWTWRDGTFDLAVQVPPNVRAHVRLPGPSVQTEEVGSGSHRWSQSLPEPSTVTSAPGMDSPMAQFADDDEARAVLLAACREVGFEFADTWADRGRWRADTTLRESIERPEEERSMVHVEAALAALARERAGRH